MIYFRTSSSYLKILKNDRQLSSGWTILHLHLTFGYEITCELIESLFKCVYGYFKRLDNLCLRFSTGHIMISYGGIFCKLPECNFEMVLMLIVTRALSESMVKRLYRNFLRFSFIICRLPATEIHTKCFPKYTVDSADKSLVN